MAQTAGRAVQPRRLLPGAAHERAGNPEEAFKIISWILSPDNQARGFTDAALFPAAPAAYELPALTGPDAFFGGQKTIEIFGPAAEKIPVRLRGPGRRGGLGALLRPS